MIDSRQTVCIIIDMQEKLLSVMVGKSELLHSVRMLIKGLQELDVPVLFTEQLPEKIGPTATAIKKLMQNTNAIPKSTFSAYRDQRFLSAMQKIDRKQVILAGIESHVCVYQTASDLLDQGYGVHVIEDGVSSRTCANKNLGIQRIQHAGGHITGVEMVLLELIKDAKHPQFKEMLNLIK